MRLPGFFHTILALTVLIYPANDIVSHPTEKPLITNKSTRLHARPVEQRNRPAVDSVGLERKDRWFTYNGHYEYFVGVDAQHIAADSTTDFISILDRFRAYRINKVRIWVDAYWNPDFLHPWIYNRITRKYDLDRWNTSYWDRVRSFVSAARDRDIVVEISLFDAYPTKPKWWSNDIMRIAWNKDHNRNNAFSTNEAGHFYPEFFDLNYEERSNSGKSLKDYQRALVDKTLHELDGYPNVYFEIMNEFFQYVSDFPDGYAKTAPWQKYWAEYVNNRTQRLVTTHVHDSVRPNTGATGVEFFWNLPYVDILNFHLYRTDPNQISDLVHTSQIKGKVLQNNESFEWYDKNGYTGSVNTSKLNAVTREAWGWFVSGGYYAFYNGHLTHFSGWEHLANRAKVLHDLADKVRFWEMSPIDPEGMEYDKLVTQGPGNSDSQWQVFANPGFEYVVYFWGEPGTDPVNIKLPPGKYRYEWYDPRNGDNLRSGIIIGADPAVLPSPPTSSWNGEVGVTLFIFAENG